MWQLSLVSTAVLLLALLPLPYGYYMFLRVIVCITALAALRTALKHPDSVWPWVYGGLAVLYNPIFPVHLRERLLWSGVNLITIILLWGGMLALKQNKRKDAPSALG